MITFLGLISSIMKVRLLLIVLIASLCACTSDYNDSDKEISFMQFTELAKNDKIEITIHIQ